MVHAPAHRAAPIAFRARNRAKGIPVRLAMIPLTCSNRRSVAGRNTLRSYAIFGTSSSSPSATAISGMMPWAWIEWPDGV